MEEQPKLPDLTEAERHALEELMPEEMSEIITSGIKRRHFLKIFAVTGTSLLAAHLLGIEQLMARSAPIAPIFINLDSGVFAGSWVYE
jgi:xanthine dehydrogenase YagT iron-sulfur-binding subunit